LALLTANLFQVAIHVSTLDQTINGPKTISERVAQYGDIVTARLKPDFAKAGSQLLRRPKDNAGSVLKEERLLSFTQKGPNKMRILIASFAPILFLAGKPAISGPSSGKAIGRCRKESYSSAESLNPTPAAIIWRFHVNYPNDFDRAEAQADGVLN